MTRQQMVTALTKHCEKTAMCNECPLFDFTGQPECNFRQLDVWSTEAVRQAYNLVFNSSAVEHPNHYNQASVECIVLMEELFGKDALKDFCLLNAFKYVWRAKQKNGLEDIKKAHFYLGKLIELEEQNAPPET